MIIRKNKSRSSTFGLTVIVLLQLFGYTAGQFVDGYTEVLQLLDEMRITSLRNHGSFSDYDSKLRAQVKPVYIDDGTEVSANRAISDSLFENDIVLTLPQAKAILDEIKNGSTPMRSRRPKRQAAVGNSLVWPVLTVPYAFRYNDPTWQSLIRQGMNDIEQQTCIRFRLIDAYRPPTDYLEYIRGSGCWSSVGRVGGRQSVSIGYGCDSVGIIAHETLHALGLWHEQSRTDRDNFITINYASISPGTESNFERRTTLNSQNYGQPYDLGSVMHYGAKAFTTNYNINTIITRSAIYQQTLGQRSGISFKDARMINVRYCSNVCQNRLNCQNGGYVDPNRCSVCRCPEGYAGTLCDLVAESNVDGCRGGNYIANSTTYSIRSPYVTARTKCYFRLRAAPNQRIEIAFSQVSFPCRDACDSYVEIKHTNDKTTTVMEYQKERKT